MPRPTNNVQIDLDTIEVSGDPFEGFQPYLWTVFFKADGTTLSLDDAGMFQGQATISTTMGSHGNLDSSGTPIVDQSIPGWQEGDSAKYNALEWQIPLQLGFWLAQIVPIPVAQSLQGTVGASDLPGQFGAVAVLLNDGGHVSEHGAEAGHAQLNQSVQNAINALIASLGPMHQTITQSDINSITAGIGPAVANAIENHQSIWENLWSLSGEDKLIGYNTWTWTQDDLWDPNSHSQNLSAAWFWYSNWTLKGSAVESTPCPADALATILNGPNPSPAEHRQPSWHTAMRRFRDSGDLARYPGLTQWWRTVSAQSPRLLNLYLKHRQMRHATGHLLDVLPKLLEKSETIVELPVLVSAQTILKFLLGSANDELRDIGLCGLRAIDKMRGQSVRRSLEILDSEAARRTLNQRFNAAFRFTPRQR